jgi:hypothetical protein
LCVSNLVLMRGSVFIVGGCGLFLQPYAAACSGSSRLYVVDSGHDCVKCFSLDGTFQRRLGGQNGREEGLFDEPSAVAVCVIHSASTVVMYSNH